ncbi:hypothetical protein RSSM_03021 [Rhodopirellula sallentina SM41]|uniref:Uncharacterized protein n=1 Tax=Rhodopirellula sallentina SM41 TaxID=1263870 RepID=M5UCH6_9BACT|nr:hypothetical protein RSSM_03021 [Rhodopirellula sallentina SM41]
MGGKIPLPNDRSLDSITFDTFCVDVAQAEHACRVLSDASGVSQPSLRSFEGTPPTG